MARQRQVVQEIPTETLEITVGRVKKDLVWVLISSVVSIAAGIAIGNFFKF
ncbi:MAG: hypothetical protein K6T65_02200 [Peptococcaceae bacterium]|nr:hypothetical protein [Peptococcaceae bacterium]